MNRLWVIPSPALKNQIARDLSHREAHRTFREDFQSKSREPGLTRRRARSRLALEAISGFSKTRNLLYPRPPSGENIPKVVAQIAPGSEKRPLSDRVLAGSNLGCQRLLKKRFFCSRTTGQSLRVGFARCAADEGSEPITGALAWA